ncbi:MAG: DegT/DnrJ/EryC1/StrS family aminotransferase [Terracidiphilus sp.]
MRWAARLGTDALWLALAGAGIGQSAGVVTTPFSFFASVSAILRAGATPVLADIDPVTFNLSATAVEAVLDGERGAGVKAILPVHLYGNCCEMEKFSPIGRERGLAIIEDAAQAWGAEWQGLEGRRRIGRCRGVQFLSDEEFKRGGDAGMVTTNRDDVAERVKVLRNQGMRRRYHHDELGWNARMDGFQGAVLSVKLKYIGAWNDERCELGGADMAGCF